MKTLILLLIIILFGGCATIPQCPPKDIDIFLLMPFGPIKIPMKKGDIDRYIKEFDEHFQNQGKSKL